MAGPGSAKAWANETLAGGGRENAGVNTPSDLPGQTLVNGCQHEMIQIKP